MKGTVRKRSRKDGSLESWELAFDLGEQPAQDCTKCRRRVWSTKQLRQCPKCHGELSEPTMRRRRVFAAGFKTRGDAERELRRRLRSLDSGVPESFERVTVRHFVEQTWLPHLETQKLVRATPLKTYRQQLRDYVLPKLGSLELRHVGPAHVQAVLDDATTLGRSARTVGHLRSVMSAMFGHAVRLQLNELPPFFRTGWLC